MGIYDNIHIPLPRFQTFPNIQDPILHNAVFQHSYTGNIPEFPRVNHVGRYMYEALVADVVDGGPAPREHMKALQTMLTSDAFLLRLESWLCLSSKVIIPSKQKLGVKGRVHLFRSYIGALYRENGYQKVFVLIFNLIYPEIDYLCSELEKLQSKDGQDGAVDLTQPSYQALSPLPPSNFLQYEVSDEEATPGPVTPPRGKDPEGLGFTIYDEEEAKAASAHLQSSEELFIQEAVPSDDDVEWDIDVDEPYDIDNEVETSQEVSIHASWLVPEISVSGRPSQPFSPFDTEDDFDLIDVDEAYSDQGSRTQSPRHSGNRESDPRIQNPMSLTTERANRPRGESPTPRESFLLQGQEREDFLIQLARSANPYGFGGPLPSSRPARRASPPPPSAVAHFGRILRRTSSPTRGLTDGGIRRRSSSGRPNRRR